MYQFVPHVVERQSLRLSCRHKSVVVGLDVGVVPDGAKCSLRQQRSELEVAVALGVGLRVDRRPRLVPEGCHATVGGQLVGLLELGEVGGVDEHRRGVDYGYALDGCDMVVVPLHRFVRPNEFPDPLLAFVDGLLYPFDIAHRGPVHEVERP